MIVAQRMQLQSIGRKRKKPRVFSTDDLLDFEEDFRELYLEIVDRLNAPPVLHNTDGDPLEMHTMKFELRLSPADAFDLLAPLLAGVREKEDVLAENEDGASDEPGTITFAWYKKGQQKDEILGQHHPGTSKAVSRTPGCRCELTKTRGKTPLGDRKPATARCRSQRNPGANRRRYA